MPTAVLTDEEKGRILHHTGYVLTDPVASIQLGIPRASQPMFLVQAQMERIPLAHVGLIRRYISILDMLEDKLVEATERFAAEKLGEITLRDNETQMLEGEYTRWAKRLADDLGVPLNPYCERFRAGAVGLPINVPRM